LGERGSLAVLIHSGIDRYIPDHHQPVSVAGSCPDLQFYFVRRVLALPAALGSR